jgi:hypothetical protein
VKGEQRCKEVIHLRKSIKKTVPHCFFCDEEIKAGQYVYMDGINGLVHAACSRWKREFIKDAGLYEEIVSKYPLYFENLKV